MLEKERAFFKLKLPELLKESKGRVVLIKGEEIVGVYNTFEDAIAVGADKFGIESFLVRRVDEKQDEISIPSLTLGILRADSTSPA